MHRRTAGGQASVKDANLGEASSMASSTRSPRGVHGVRSLRIRDADYSYLKNYANSSAAVSDFLCAFLYWNTRFPLFLDILSCFLF